MNKTKQNKITLQINELIKKFSKNGKEKIFKIKNSRENRKESENIRLEKKQVK